MKTHHRSARKVTILLGALTLGCISGAATAACPQGTVQVGERRETQGNVIIVHPVCRKTTIIAPTAPNMPFRTTAVEDAVELLIESPDGATLTGAEAGHSPLVLGSRLVTGSHGRARFHLEDGTVVSLGPNTDIKLEKKPGKLEPSDSTPLLSLTKGFAHWVSHGAKRLNHRLNKRFALRIYGVGNVGVRGTDFEVQVKPDKSGFVRLSQGIIVYTAEKGPSIEIHPGQVLQFRGSHILGVH